MNYNPSNIFGIFIDWKKALGYSRCGLCAKREKCNILDLYGKCQDFEMTKNEIISIVTDSGEVLYSRCNKCVYLKETCGQTDKDGKCQKYKRDPPDGGYYG